MNSLDVQPSGPQWQPVVGEKQTTEKLVTLLREARDFVGKSRCSQGHSVSEVVDRANPRHFGHCIYCKHQYGLFQELAGEVVQRAGTPQPVAHQVHEGNLRLIFEHGEPHGIRDTRGFMLHFHRVPKFSGQEERYRNELAQRARLADFLLEALRRSDETLAAAAPVATLDSRRLDFIAAEYLHIIPFDMPTGAGDADVGWRALQSHMGNGDIEIAVVYRDDIREVIDAARKSLETPVEASPLTGECPNCFGDRTVTMSDGSKRPCELCAHETVPPPPAAPPMREITEGGRPPLSPRYRWISFGSMNNGRCCYAWLANFAACRLPAGHDGPHLRDGESEVSPP